jgi:hypothetical protein
VIVIVEKLVDISDIKVITADLTGFNVGFIDWRNL